MSFEKKTINGEPNPKYIDLLDEDQPIAGQKFACMSFISPEKILKKRELFLFEHFVRQWDFSKSMEKFFEFVHFLSYKYNLNADDAIKDLTEYVTDEGEKLKSISLNEDFQVFLDKQEEKLNEQFNKEHSFQTSMRGIKIRGVFQTQEEAELRCKKLREHDPNHDIFVGPVGIWCPWHPDPYKTGRVEFMEEELNALHNEKIKNEELAKQEFDKRVMDSKKKAIEDNIKLAEKTGNKLTQSMDEQGNLIGIKETIDFESREVASQDVNDEIRKQLENKFA